MHLLIAVTKPSNYAIATSKLNDLKDDHSLYLDENTSAENVCLEYVRQHPEKFNSTYYLI